MMKINIGDIVEVIPQDDKPWTLDWREQFVVVGINAKRVLKYDIGILDYTLVPVRSPEDGGTDGFSAEDLRIVTAKNQPPAQPVAADDRIAEIIGHYLRGEKRTVYPGQAADDVRHLLAVMGQPVAVEVKPLVWHENGRPDEFYASTIFGGAYVCNLRGRHRGFGAHFTALGRAGKFQVDGFEEPEEAVEAVNKFYRDTILSTINARPEAVVKAEAMREIAKRIRNDVTPGGLLDKGVDHAVWMCNTEADRLDPPKGAV